MERFRLTDEDAALLRDSPILHRETRHTAVDTFYRNLFERRPDLRPLFSDDLTEQTRTFGATLAVMVFSMSDWDNFRPVIEALARRHLRYGVKRADYGDVRLALFDTLHQINCSEAQTDLWQSLFDAIADHMITAAYPESST